MKLRNKKTDEIKEGVEITIWIDREGIHKFGSIDQLNEEWEDYTLKEPLIKDPKIRKVLRAWAEMFNFKDEFRYMKLHGVNGNFIGCHQFSIDIPNIEGLQEYKCYTITELCGEEEE